jgi:hypothetical protein
MGGSVGFVRSAKADAFGNFALQCIEALGLIDYPNNEQVRGGVAYSESQRE